MEGSFEAKDSRMVDYLQLVKQTMNQFRESKGYSNCLGAKPTCRFISHLGVITNQGGTTVNQSGGGGGTQY